MKLPLLGADCDERLQQHNLRSTRIDAIAGVAVACGLFEYHLIRQHVYRSDLAAVALTIVVVKMAFMTWYRFTH